MMPRRDPGCFFIIGAMKAGTTSLFKHLAGHPELYPSPRKEPRIFRDDTDPSRQRAAFLELFSGRTDQPWCFEASTAYTKFPRVSGVPQRLHAIVPDARFVYLVRNPVERVWSHYVHNLAHGRETLPFDAALERRRQYLDISRYHLQLSQYLAVFPRERLLVQVFEEMVATPADTVREVSKFLGIDPTYRPPAAEVAHNASSSKLKAAAPLRLARHAGIDEMLPWRVRHWLRQRGTPLPTRHAELTPELRARVADALRDDTEALFEFLGRRIPSWRDFA